MTQLETLAHVDTRHEDMIHDAQLDYFGKRLATASSDRTVRVFDVVGDKYNLVAELKGHDGPVWQISWAHPKFGSVLASCSYDRKVFIWRETAGQWSKVGEFIEHSSSVNSIAWAIPDQSTLLIDEHGLFLACASSDGYVSVISGSTGSDSNWEAIKFNAHEGGCNAVSWASAYNLVSGSMGRRLVTGGCDSAVKIWRFSADKKWELEATLDGNSFENAHSDWVRDVAWAANIGLPYNMIASCGQDGKLIVWTESNAGEWQPTVINRFQDVVWRVSWSITGNILAASGGDNKITLWKEGLEGKWVCFTEMNEDSVQS